jgi:hypothetical protein
LLVEPRRRIAHLPELLTKLSSDTVDIAPRLKIAPQAATVWHIKKPRIKSFAGLIVEIPIVPRAIKFRTKNPMQVEPGAAGAGDSDL